MPINLVEFLSLPRYQLGLLMLIKAVEPLSGLLGSELKGVVKRSVKLLVPLVG